MIEKPEKNKMMHAEDATKKDGPITEDYFFPQHQKTITATSREEAEKKLKEIIKTEK